MEGTQGKSSLDWALKRLKNSKEKQCCISENGNRKIQVSEDKPGLLQVWSTTAGGLGWGV